MRLHKELLCGQQKRRIATVHAGVLDVLGDSIINHLAILGDGVKLHLLGANDVLRDDHWILAAYNRGMLQEALQLVVGGNNTHGRAAENVRWPHKSGVADVFAKVDGLLCGRELRPLGLVDTECIAKLAEFKTVLASVDRLHRSAEDLHAAAVEPHRKVVGRLAPHGNDNAGGLFKLNDIHHRLVAELLEVQAVGLVVVGGHRLRVAINRYGLVAERAECLDAGH
mmetsp:Transcript_6967/g.17402  ORF Transcript_6967/g.17402 Transcript_6967/m.17402 type:complete len:225 (-) Transcript_6967:3492-4166(-)